MPRLIAARRAEIADRIAGLRALASRLGDLEDHLTRPRRSLDVLGMSGPCCDAADVVVGTVEGSCACCSPTLVEAT